MPRINTFIPESPFGADKICIIGTQFTDETDEMMIWMRARERESESESESERERERESRACAEQDNR